MEKRKNFLIGVGLLSLASLILIPYKTNALTGSNANSGYILTGTNINSGYNMIESNSNSGYVLSGSNANSGYILTGSIPTPNNGPEGKLTNKLKKTIEFKTNEISRKVVFNGTYTALKDNVSIKFFGIEDIDKFMLDDDKDYFTKRCKKNKTSLEFYLTINGEEVDKTIKIDDACNFGSGAVQGVWIDEVKVKKGESVNIKVEVEVQGISQEDDMYKTQLILQSKSFGYNSSDIKEALAPIKIVKYNNSGSGSNLTGYILTGSIPNINTGAYAKLTNKLTKTIEYNTNEVSKKVVFDGTYTALKKHSIVGFNIEHSNVDTGNCYNNISHNTINFNLYINGKLVGSNINPSRNDITLNSCQYFGSLSFDKIINVKTGDIIQIKIEGELDSLTFGHTDNASIYQHKLSFFGTGGYKDILASANLAPIKIVDNNDFIIQTSSKQNTVILKGENSTLSEFVIKPSKGNNKHLDELTIEIDDPFINRNDIVLMIDGTEYEPTSDKSSFTYQPDIDISSKGATVKVFLEDEPKYDDYIIITSIKSINGKSVGKTFSKRFVSALVYITKQENKGDYTEFTLGIEKYDDNFSISSICMLTGSTGAGTCLLGEKYADGPFEDGYKFNVINTNSIQSINYISYFLKDSERNGWGDSITIKREDYPDYFKTKSLESRKIFANNRTSKEEIENNPTTTSQKYTNEMIEAYQFAYNNGIISSDSIEKAKMNSPLTRIAMAKMLSNFAINVLGQQPDAEKGIIKFNDVPDKLNKKYDNAVTLAYQLGIMGQSIKNNKFRPNDVVTRAEFATALSRMLYGTEDGKGKTKYYEPHINKLYEEGIINKKDHKIKEKRGYVMIMLMRASELYNTDYVDCNDPMVALACEANSDACPFVCR